MAMNTDLLTYAQFDSGMGDVTAIYMGFESDGLFYCHPALNLTNYTEKYTFLYDVSEDCQRSNQNFINVSCLDWYVKSKEYYYTTMNYSSYLDKFDKRINFFPSAIWDETVKMMIVTLCSYFMDESNNLMGVMCFELNTRSNFFDLSLVNEKQKIRFDRLSIEFNY